METTIVLFWKEYAHQWSNPCGFDDAKTNEMAIVDVDANKGQGMHYWYHTFRNGKGWNCTKVFLFEPNLVNIKLIKEKITKNANKYSDFGLVETAISNFTGKPTFHTKHENNPRNQHGALNPKNEETFEVNVISIDKYFKNKQIKEIPLMKIDTEEFDAFILFASNL